MRQAILAIAMTVVGFRFAVAGEADGENPASNRNESPTAGSGVQGGEESWKLLPIPEITLTRDVTASDEEAETIRKLIAQLADVDSEDYGFSSTLPGAAFAPIDSADRFHGEIWEADQMQRNQAFTKLVELGPKALPFLLDALDDDTRTRLTIEDTGASGGMWLGHEIYRNPLNEREAAAIRNAPIEQAAKLEGPYVVRVGDLCFAAIGTIANRSYAAVHCDADERVIVNSPIQDMKLRLEVWGVWRGGDVGRKLLDSLLVDFQTRGEGSARLQISAAIILLYYFPEESAGLIAERLTGLDVTTEDEAARFAANGLSDYELVAAVSLAEYLLPNPTIHKALREVAQHATQANTLLACLLVVDEDQCDVPLARLADLARRSNIVDDEDCGYPGIPYHVAERFPNRAQDVLRAYLEIDNLSRRLTVISSVREYCGHLSLELLGPFLDDTRQTGSKYAVDPGRPETQLPKRVCDEAAEIIAANFDEFDFKLEGTHEDVDRQIEAMRAKIEAMPSP